jgi:uncharacterized protein (UPF0276 family)
MIDRDLVGIGFRPELATSILSHLEHIDVVEVIADDYFDAPRKNLRSLETLAAQVPVVVHGISLGLASVSRVEERRLEAMARVVRAVRPAFWSEHLAFVRSNGFEIGHLAAPPRCEATVNGTAENVRRARAVVGSSPLLENVATLVDPPGSSYDEASFVSRTVLATNAELLLDLNNLHSNATNFGFAARGFLQQIPLEHVRAVHLAGGSWVCAASGERRLLDDHMHDVPHAVFELLEEVGARVPHPITVILERDGAYPPFSELLAELQRARGALAAGRRRASTTAPHAGPCEPLRHSPSSVLEAYLARLYVDSEERARFMADPNTQARLAGLSAEERAELVAFDVTGLELAAESFARKRVEKRRSRWSGLRNRSS